MPLPEDVELPEVDDEEDDAAAAADEEDEGSLAFVNVDLSPAFHTVKYEVAPSEVPQLTSPYPGQGVVHSESVTLSSAGGMVSPHQQSVPLIAMTGLFNGTQISWQ